MKRNILLLALIFSTICLKAQKGSLKVMSQGNLVSMSPDTAVLGDYLTTTVTGNNTVFQNSSPQGNINNVYLQSGTASLNINWWSTGLVQDDTHFTMDVSVPGTADTGYYKLYVEIQEGPPFYNSYTLSLDSAFFVKPPDGYIMGNVYLDLNSNGIKDAGEPPVSNQNVDIGGLGYAYTDAGGNYSYGVKNGTYAITWASNYGDMYFLTSTPTLSATINYNNSTGNNFGLKRGLISISPNTATAGDTVHLTVVSDSIFRTTANPWGNISQAILAGYSASSANITVINTDTALVTIKLPSNLAAGNYDFYVNLSSVSIGYHYLRKSFTVAAAPSSVKGTVFFDPNKNGIKDTNEYGLHSWANQINVSPDNFSVYVDWSGNYSAALTNANHTVSLTYDPNFQLTTVPSYTFTSLNNVTSGKDFGLASIYPDYTTTVSVWGWSGCVNPGYLEIAFKNMGNLPFNGYAYIVKDPLLKYDSLKTYMKPSSIKGDTLFWNLTNVLPLYYKYIWAAFSPLPVGTVVNFSAGLVALNGSTVASKVTAKSSYTVTCSFDPNDKAVMPGGAGSDHYIHATDSLRYMIRFQNTGTDTAYKVVVTDRLDPDLNWTTFKLEGSSHSVNVELNKNTGLLTFTFLNILLPDSGTNQIGSNGFVIYSIKPKAGLPNYTRIENNTNIFFDNNDPVTTNTTLNTLCVPNGMNTNASICMGDLYNFLGQILTRSGKYYGLLSNMGGCDSLVTLNLEVKDRSAANVGATVCYLDNYNFNGTILTNAGTYYDTLVSANGCDSIITLELMVDQIDTTITILGNVLTATANAGTYQWLDCDNSKAVIPGETANTFSPSSSGNYAVVIDDGICIDTSACYAFIFTGTGEQSLFTSYISGDELILSFKTQLGKKGILRIYNVLSEKVFESNFIVEPRVAYNLSVLNERRGIYFIEAEVENSRTINKVIVMH